MTSTTIAENPVPPEPSSTNCRSGFQRSYSRVFYESDYSTPTSWEFCGLHSTEKSVVGRQSGGSFSKRTPTNSSSHLLHQHSSSSTSTSPMPNLAQLSILRSSNLSASENSQAELRPDGSRNSTGSSTGSHKSQDSGFSDSGETRRQQQLQLAQLQSQSLCNNHNSSTSNRSQNISNSKNINLQNMPYCPGSFHNSNSQILLSSHNHSHHRHSSCDHSNHYHDLHLSLPVPPLPTTNVPVSVVINGNPTCLHSPFANCSHQMNVDCMNGNCSFQEIIIAGSEEGVISPFPSSDHHQHQQHHRPQSNDTNGLIGAPTCCSTPKKSSVSSPPTFTPSKMTVMQKIDNFESLNKNVTVAKILDSNNNSNLSIGNESRSSFFSRPPSRIPTPPPITPIQSVTNVRNTNDRSLSCTLNSNCSGGKITTSSSSNTCTTIISNNNRSNNDVVDEDKLPDNNESSSHLSSSYSSLLRQKQQLIQLQLQRKQEDLSSLLLCSRLSPKLQHDVSNYSSQPNKSFSKIHNNSLNWQSLPKGFKRIYIRDSTPKEMIVKSHFDNDSVRLWLHELRAHTEPECSYTLQLKDLNVSSYYYPNESIVSANLNTSIAQPGNNNNNNRHNISSSVPVHLVSSSILSIRHVEKIASIISGEFSRICKYLEFKLYAQVPPIIFSLLENIEDFLNQLKESHEFLTKEENRLIGACSDLRMSTLKFCDDAKKLSHSQEITQGGVEGRSQHQQQEQRRKSTAKDDKKGIETTNDLTNNIYMNDVVEGVASIGNQFSQVVDQRLTKDLSSILDVIESGGLGARMALESFSIVLYDGGMHICRLASSIRTVRGLLSCLIESRDETEQILALRCLATVLCVGEAVKDFDNAGGFEIIADILHDGSFGLTMKCEAVAVLTQVTDPWIDLETTLCNLGSHLEKIVVSLTNLVQLCSGDADSFLLIMAAISNLTFLELYSIQLLEFHGTIPLIVNAVKQKSEYYSVFIMDHVSTILANMAGIEKCRPEVVKSDGISILIYFINKSPSPFYSLAEITACERLQQKSTIAISRLASETGVAENVLKLGGVQRLVQLSKEDKERNYSDGVLIACLATLRKLVTVCGSELIQQLHAEDLIYPRLLDSFLLFSSRQESCV